MMMYVVRDRELMSSIRQLLVDYGLGYSVYELIAVFSECTILVLSVSFMWRRRILKQIKRRLVGKTPPYPIDHALSRYGRSVTVSSFLVLLILAAGLLLLLATGGANGAFATVMALGALGLFLIAYTHRGFVEIAASRTETMAPRDSSGASEFGLELECAGMGIGLLKLPGGSLVVGPDELQIRSFWWGNYTLPADQISALRVVDSHWLTGLIVRIEHGARNVPKAIFLRFDSEPDEFFREIASTGFAPRCPRTKGTPKRGLLSNWLPW